MQNLDNEHMTDEHIKPLVPAAVADAVLNDDHMNNYVFPNAQAIEAAQLDEYTRGAVIFGVEPIDDPEPDGLNVYIRRPAGDCVLLTIDATDPDGIITATIAPIEGKP